MVKSGGTISYTYGAAGNRISKTANGKTTIYVRDASGNVMSVYEAPVNTTALKQIETHLYGSSRLGITGEQTVATTPISLASGFGGGNLSVFTRGEKSYELSNHLGNVLVTLSDKKKGIASATNSSLTDHYEADVVTAQDYYPFGMLMPGRRGYASQGGWAVGGNGSSSLPAHLTIDSRTGNVPLEYKATETIEFTGEFESGASDEFTAFITEGSTGGVSANGIDGEEGVYRYGFNGKENDNEVKGEGNEQDYGMRIYDPRLGRFLSVDPLTESYPWFTPYQFAGNMPVWAIDIDGMEGDKKPNANEKTNEEQKDKAMKSLFDMLDKNLQGGEAKNAEKKSFLQSAIKTKVHEIIQIRKAKQRVADDLLNTTEPLGAEATLKLKLYNQYEAQESGKQKQVAWLVTQLSKAIADDKNIEVYNKWLTTELKVIDFGVNAMATAASFIPSGGSSAGFFNLTGLEAKAITGGGKQWLRFGYSYSKFGSTPTIGFRWGAGGSFSKTIGSTMLKTFNEALRTKRVIPGLRTWWNEPGHLHLLRMPSKSFYGKMSLESMKIFF